MGQEEKKFVAIRMIVLKPGQDASAFRDWMISDQGFLDKMGGVFKNDGLEMIMFLQGNKQNGLTEEPYPLQSSQSPPPITAAGANADFAWITQWASKAVNQASWSASKNNLQWRAVWKDFMDCCFPRSPGLVPSRPLHGPPYDYLGGVPTKGLAHYGRGAGCLVEGFELIYCKSEWLDWTSQQRESSA